MLRPPPKSAAHPRTRVAHTRHAAMKVRKNSAGRVAELSQPEGLIAVVEAQKVERVRQPVHGKAGCQQSAIHSTKLAPKAASAPVI